MLERYLRGETVGTVDWQANWRLTGVTPEEWAALQARLGEAYRSVSAVLRDFETWEGEHDIGGALAIVAHTAYHLGEIRQALCTVRR